MQLVPQFQLVPVLPPTQLGLTAQQLQQLQQFGLAGVPIIVQPVQMSVATQPVPIAGSNTASPPSEQLLRALHNAAIELGRLPLSADANCVRQRLRNLLLIATSQSIDTILKECEAFVDKVVRMLLLRCRQVQPVDVWTLLRNKGCQFLGQYQATILQNLIAVLRQHAIMPRKNLIELVVDACERSGARVSKTAVGRVVQLLYRSGCFHIHKDCDGGDIMSCASAQQAKNTRMQLREEFFNYEALRRTHDSLIVQWAHEEGLFLSAERWSHMLYQDKRHNVYLQTIIDQKAVSLSKCIDTLYKYALGIPAVEDCASALRQFAAIPALGNREGGDGFQMSTARATVQDVHTALLRVLSLVNAFTSFLRSAAPLSVSSQCPTDAASSSAKGRFVLGVGHTPTRSIASSAEDHDQPSPTAPAARPHSCSLNSPPCNVVSPPALLGKSEELDSDFDEHMSATETPVFRPPTHTPPHGTARSPTAPKPSVPLAVVERWVSGALNENAKPTNRDGDWDAWKWQGPNGLLVGARRPQTDSFDPLGSEDMLIAPMIYELIDIDEDGPKQGPPKWPGDAHRPPTYARTVSSTTADNALLPDATGDLTMQHGNYPWLFRAASFQDPNSLHF